MQIIGVQILAIFFALFMLYVTFLHYRKDEIANGTFFFWITLWLAFIFLTIFPQILAPLIGPLRIFRILDFLMLGALAIITFVSFESHVKTRTIDKKIEGLIRKNALKEVKTKKR